MVAIATLFFAAGWAVAAHHLARHVGSINVARLLGAMMAAGAGAGAAIDASGNAGAMPESEYHPAAPSAGHALATRPATPQSQPSPFAGRPRSFFSLLGAARPTEAQQEEIRRLQRQTTAVEVILNVWRIAMFVAAGAMMFLAVLAATTRHARRWLLGISGIIFLSTLATLAAMHLLERPDLGGLPPLSVLSYAIVALVQGAYGFVLIALRSRQLPVSSDRSEHW